MAVRAMSKGLARARDRHSNKRYVSKSKQPHEIFLEGTLPSTSISFGSLVTRIQIGLADSKLLTGGGTVLYCGADPLVAPNVSNHLQG